MAVMPVSLPATLTGSVSVMDGVAVPESEGVEWKVSPSPLSAVLSSLGKATMLSKSLRDGLSASGVLVHTGSSGMKCEAPSCNPSEMWLSEIRSWFLSPAADVPLL